MPLTTRELARLAKISEQSVRNYTRDYAELLSPQARGETGNRLFDDADVQTLCAIAELRRENVPPDTIRERLSRGDVYIDVATDDHNTPQQATSAQEGPQAHVLALVVQHDLERRLDAVERAQQLLEAERATERRNDKLQGALWGAIAAFAFGGFVLWSIWFFV